jgi:hypothetical protein
VAEWVARPRIGLESAGANGVEEAFQRLDKELRAA